MVLGLRLVTGGRGALPNGTVVSRATRGILVDDRGQTIDWEPPDSVRCTSSSDGLVRLAGLAFEVIEAGDELFALRTIGDLRVLGPRSLSQQHGAWHAEFDVVPASEGPREIVSVRLSMPPVVVRRGPARSGVSVFQLLINAVEDTYCSDDVALAIASAVKSDEQAFVTFDGGFVLNPSPNPRHWRATESSSRERDRTATAGMFGRLAAGYPGDLQDPQMFARFSSARPATTDAIASFVRCVDPDGWAAEREYREQLGIFVASVGKSAQTGDGDVIGAKDRSGAFE